VFYDIGADSGLGLTETWTQTADFLKEEKMPATRKVDGQDLPASAFAYVGDASNWRTFLLPIHFAGSGEKTVNHIKNALVRFAEVKGIPAAQASEVWQRIVGAARAHGIDANPRQPFRAKEIETAPAPPVGARPCTPEGTEEQTEAMRALAEDRHYERMQADIQAVEEELWRERAREQLKELKAS